MKGTPSRGRYCAARAGWALCSTTPSRLLHSFFTSCGYNRARSYRIVNCQPEQSIERGSTMSKRITISTQNRRNWLIDAAVLLGGILAALSGIYFLFLCHQCGSALREDADFCHRCGIQRRSR